MTPQEAAGAPTAGLGESRVGSRQLNAQKDPASLAVLLVCIAQNCCAAFFVSFKACFLTSLGATSQLLDHLF